MNNISISDIRFTKMLTLCLILHNSWLNDCNNLNGDFKLGNHNSDKYQITLYDVNVRNAKVLIKLQELLSKINVFLN